MIHSLRRIGLGFFLFFMGFQTALAVDDEALIRIEDTPKAYLLSVPVSKLEMTVPKGTWALKAESLKGTDQSPRYFYFEDNINSLVISGWFESADHFEGPNKFWDSETATWKKNNLPEPLDVSFAKIGDWDVIFYDMKVPGVTNSNIRAHFVRAGTWIDVHISTTSVRTSAESRGLLKTVLESLSVVEK